MSKFSNLLVMVGLFDLRIETDVPLPRDYVILIPNIKLMPYGLMLMLRYWPLGILVAKKGLVTDYDHNN